MGVFLFISGLFSLVFTLVDIFYLKLIKSKTIKDKETLVLLKAFIWLLTSMLLFIIGFILHKYRGPLIPSLLKPLYLVYLIFNGSFFIVVLFLLIINLINISYKKLKNKNKMGYLE